MDEIEASLIVSGPMTAADERRILWAMRPALWQELQDILVDEDDELRYGSTQEGMGGAVLDILVHFRVSDVAKAVSAVRRCYTASGLGLRATVCVYGPAWDVVARHQIAGG